MAKKIKQTTINPLLALAGLGETVEVTDVAAGRDEQMLREGIDPVTGWNCAPNTSVPSMYPSASPG